MLFTGEYEHTIDDKGRLAVPAEIRGRLQPEGSALYIVPGSREAPWLWPETTFEGMATGAVLLQRDAMREFEQFLYPLSRRLEIDKAGRIRVPDRYLRDYGLDSTVVITGVKDHLEIYTPDTWAEKRRQLMERQPEIMHRAMDAMDAARHRDFRSGSTEP